jgi:hypothetical protein
VALPRRPVNLLISAGSEPRIADLWRSVGASWSAASLPAQRPGGRMQPDGSSYCTRCCCLGPVASRPRHRRATSRPHRRTGWATRLSRASRSAASCTQATAGRRRAAQRPSACSTGWAAANSAASTTASTIALLPGADPQVGLGASGSRRAATDVRNDRGARPQTVEDHDRRSCRRRLLTGVSHLSPRSSTPRNSLMECPVQISHGGSQGFKSPHLHLHPTLMTSANAGRTSVRLPVIAA